MRLKVFEGIGAALAGLGVILGAFGAHSLKNVLDPQALGTFEVGVRYHMLHALALIFVGILGRGRDDTLLHWSGRSFVLGILLFSGSLYVLALTDIKILGAITPFGGLAFIVGWVIMAWDRWRAES